LVVGSDVTINKRLFTVGDASFSGNLYVAFDTSLNSRLVVGSDVTINKRLFTVGDASFSGNLYVAFDTSLNSSLVVGSDVTINKRLFTVGDASLNGNLFVAFDTSLKSRLVVGSDATVNKRLFTVGDASLNGNLFVAYDTSLNSRLVVGSDVTINKRLFTLGDASFNGNLQMNTMYIASTDNVNSWIVNKSLISNISTAFALFQGSGGNTVLNSYTGQPLQFKINNSEKMRVCQNGNISIGSDTDVSAFVQIYNSSSDTTYPTLSVGDGIIDNASTYGMLHLTRSYTNSDNKHYISFIRAGNTVFGMGYVSNSNTFGFFNAIGNAASTPAISVDSAGKIGIGTKSPTQILDVNGTVRVNATNNVYNKLLVLYDGNTGEAVSGATSFYGFGVNSGTLRYQVETTSAVHSFYCGATIAATIGGSNISTSGTFKFFTSGVTTLTNTTTTAPTSVYIRSFGQIVSTGFYAVSDKRVKCNIHDVADITSRQLLSHLKPRIFNYIDNIINGIEPIWGFIAQEVAEIIPNAVTYTADFIPNIFEVAEIIGKEIKLGSKTTTDLLKDEDGYYKIKIKNTKGDDIIVKITEIIDENTFKIDQEIETDYNRIFVYGQEVPDFHSLDKDAIFTITTAAVQEIDKELHETNKRVKILEEENQNLKQQINDIMERLAKANI